MQTIPVATDSEKRRQVNPCKVYPADPALIPVFDRRGKPNTGHDMPFRIQIPGRWVDAAAGEGS